MNPAEVLALRQAFWAIGYRPVGAWSPGAEDDKGEPIPDTSAELPLVSAEDALGDAIWFQRRPHRRFRLRHGDCGWWLVRKQGQVFLRTWTPQAIGPLDDDKEIATRWYATAWPGLFSKSMKRGRKAAGERR